MILPHLNKNLKSRIAKSKIIQSIREIWDFFYSNPNQTISLDGIHLRQTIEPIKIFQNLKNQMDVLRFGRTRSHPFAKKHFIGVFISNIAIIQTFLFLVFEADEFEVMLESIYITTVGISIYLSFINMLFNTPKLFMFLDKMDEFVNRSEL